MSDVVPVSVDFYMAACLLVGEVNWIISWKNHIQYFGACGLVMILCIVKIEFFFSLEFQPNFIIVYVNCERQCLVINPAN